MKIINYIPIKSVAAAIVAGISILIIGYLLYHYFQPYCEPCPAGVKCAPCTSKEQKAVVFVTAFLELIVLAKGMIVAPATPQKP
jgi:tetrahydromethanopterin S-methyltransferase subunit D